jgi:hypothetical protein
VHQEPVVQHVCCTSVWAGARGDACVIAHAHRPAAQAASSYGTCLLLTALIAVLLQGMQQRRPPPR